MKELVCLRPSLISSYVSVCDRCPPKRSNGSLPSGAPVRGYHKRETLRCVSGTRTFLSRVGAEVHQMRLHRQGVCSVRGDAPPASAPGPAPRLLCQPSAHLSFLDECHSASSAGASQRPLLWLVRGGGCGRARRRPTGQTAQAASWEGR